MFKELRFVYLENGSNSSPEGPADASTESMIFTEEGIQDIDNQDWADVVSVASDEIQTTVYTVNEPLSIGLLQTQLPEFTRGFLAMGATQAPDTVTITLPNGPAPRSYSFQQVANNSRVAMELPVGTIITVSSSQSVTPDAQAQSEPAITDQPDLSEAEARHTRAQTARQSMSRRSISSQETSTGDVRPGPRRATPQAPSSREERAEVASTSEAGSSVEQETTPINTPAVSTSPPDFNFQARAEEARVRGSEARLREEAEAARQPQVNPEAERIVQNSPELPIPDLARIEADIRERHESQS